MTSSGLEWSQPLTITHVIEGIQRMVYDLHVLAANEKRQFTGVVFTDILFTSPDEEKTLWRVTIEPQGLFEVEEREDDEDVRTTP